VTDFALTSPLPYDLDQTGADFFPTPPWVTEALLDTCPPPPGRVLEPAAGDGAIVRVLLERGYEVHAVELRGEELPGLARLCPTMIGDWLKVARDPAVLFQAAGGKPKSIVTNVPFSIGRAFAEACLSVGAVYVALLFPVTALAGSAQEWGPFWAVHPPTAGRPVRRRPRFDRGSKGTDRVGVCWWIWQQCRAPMDLVIVG